MRYLLLSALLFATQFAYSKDVFSPDSSVSKEYAASLTGYVPSGNFSAHRNTRNEGKVHIMVDGFLENLVVKISQPGITGGGAIGFGGELGMSILLPTGNSNALNVLYIGGYGYSSNLKEKTTDPSGNKKNVTGNMGGFGIPISFSRIGNAEGSGLYWEAGANISHIFRVDYNSVDVTKNYNSIFIEPFIGAGLSIAFEEISRHSRNVVAQGKLLIGPYFSYVVTNMSSVSGVTVNGYAFGLMVRYTYL